MSYSPTKKSLHAVLTGDIVNFTLLKEAMEKQLLANLGDVLDPYVYEFYRGDSFQVYLKDPQDALKIALLCRTSAIAMTEDKEVAGYDVRISMGIGEVEEPVTKPGLAKGEAFLLSGRNFDEILRTNTRLVIVSSNELANAGLGILSDYLNSIYGDMTPKQAQVIAGLLAGETQQKQAEATGRSKSTIHQLTVSGRWPEIERLLQQFENLINHLL